MKDKATRKTGAGQISYTFVVSLYCTLMIWSAFVSIDRHMAITASTATAAPLAGASR